MERGGGEQLPYRWKTVFKWHDGLNFQLPLGNRLRFTNAFGYLSVPREEYLLKVAKQVKLIIITMVK